MSLNGYPIWLQILSSFPDWMRKMEKLLSLFSAATFLWHPFSRSYGVILPSSLTMLLPPALGFSPHPPVSVYGTGMCITIAAFLGTWLTRFPTLVRSTLRLRIVRKICCPYSYPACTGFLFPGSCSPHASPQFWVHIVQESPPVIHRLRLSTSP